MEAWTGLILAYQTETGSSVLGMSVVELPSKDQDLFMP